MSCSRVRLFAESLVRQLQLSNFNTSLASASSLGLDKMAKIEQAKKVGALVAEHAKAAGVEQVVFDRNGYLYHGRVQALADAAREGGLKF